MRTWHLSLKLCSSCENAGIRKELALGTSWSTASSRKRMWYVWYFLTALFICVLSTDYWHVWSRFLNFCNYYTQQWAPKKKVTRWSVVSQCIVINPVGRGNCCFFLFCSCGFRHSVSGTNCMTTQTMALRHRTRRLNIPFSTAAAICRCQDWYICSSEFLSWCK